MATLEDPGSVIRLMDAVQARLPGVVTEIARAAIWETIEDFCARSSYYSQLIAWTRDADTLVTLTAPTYAVIQRVLEVYGADSYIVVQPDSFFIEDAGSNSGIALVAVRPLSLDYTPANILSTWFEALYEGTLARLYAEPGKPYSSKEAVSYFTERFEKFIEQASQQAPRGVNPSVVYSGSVARLYNSVRADIGDAPHSILQAALWDTITDFCTRTSYYNQLVAWSLTSGTAVTLQAPPNTVIQRIIEIYGADSYIITQPNAFFVEDGTTASGVALVALSPASLDQTPDVIFSTWFEALREGMLARLYAAPGRPHSNKEAVSYFSERYERFVEQATGQATRGANPTTIGSGSINRLYASIRADIGDVPHNILQPALWDTINDFYARSGYYSTGVLLGAVPVSGNIIRVPVPIAGTVIQRIVEVYGLSSYTIIQPDFIASDDGSFASARVLVHLRPDTLTNTPDSHISTWFDAFREGVLARLYGDAARPYANKDASLYYSERFEKRLAQATAQAPRFFQEQHAYTSSADRLYLALRTCVGFDVPQTLIRQAAWQTVEDFYIQSTTSRREVEWVMPPGVSSVNLEPNDGIMKIAWILGYNGLTNSRIDHPSILRDLTSPVPDGERKGKALLALKPLNLGVVDDLNYEDFWSTWFETIHAGSLYRLYLNPSAPYANPKFAEINYKQYRRGIAVARDTARRGYSAGAPYPFPYFANGRHH